MGRVILNQERLYLENIGGTAALRASVAVENGDAAVSYTHLDVYKRQTYMRGLIFFSLALPVRTFSRFQEMTPMRCV